MLFYEYFPIYLNTIGLNNYLKNNEVKSSHIKCLSKIESICSCGIEQISVVHIERNRGSSVTVEVNTRRSCSLILILILILEKKN